MQNCIFYRIIKVFSYLGENSESLLHIEYHNALNCPFDKTPFKNELIDNILVSYDLISSDITKQ